MRGTDVSNGDNQSLYQGRVAGEMQQDFTRMETDISKVGEHK